MKRDVVLCALTLLGLAVTRLASAQLTLDGTGYHQPFDALASGVPPGWSVRTNATATDPGSAAPFTAAVTPWSSTSGQFANFAGVIDDGGAPFAGTENATTQHSATNRCLGIRATGSFGDPGAAIVLHLQNTLGFADFKLELDWNLLSVQGRSTIWTVDYGIGDVPASFVAVATCSDSGTFGATRQTFGFGNALDNKSESVWIRIVALAPSTGSGSRDTLGIDNAVLSYKPWVEDTNPPLIGLEPQSRTNLAASSAVFAASASGGIPMTYQWWKNGLALTNGGNVSGADSMTLTLTDVLAKDAGSYSVAITNAFGFAISSNAILTVVDPVIAIPPASRTNLNGDSATFSTSAIGTGPLKFQWRFNGSDIEGATGSSLSVTNLRIQNQGDYSVVVSNSSSVTTSAVAALTVLATPPVRLARWDFNATNGLSPITPSASSGAGTAALAGSTQGSFSSGSPCDAVELPESINNAWNTAAYPTQGNSNKTAGVQFHVSTLGHRDVLLTWEQRNSASASRYLRIQYTLNGLDFIDADVIPMTATNSSFVFFCYNLAGIPAVNDNPDFAFRLVSEFESTALGTGQDRYLPTSPAGSYTSGGTIRLDLVNVFAAPIESVTSPSLEIRREGTNAVLTWNSPGFDLQTSVRMGDVYTNLPGAMSPFRTPATGAHRYFRLKAQ